MILSPYRNPPYRVPTPKSSSSPPRSPKRKRNDGSHSPPLESNTTSQTQEERLPSSPRMQVAEKLKDLDIRKLKSTHHQAVPKQSQVKRKRLKRNSAVADLGDSCMVRTPEWSKYDLQETPASSYEVVETPDCRAPAHTSPSPVPVRARELEGGSNKLADPEQESEVVDRASLPRSPVSTDPDTIVVAQVEERSLSPLPLREDLTSDQAALTWQEDEITGHDVDPASGDDGEGINGIGFRPTPAIAYARQQRRKQQVNEWKVREAREARQKRIERRRVRPSKAQPNGFEIVETESKRIVRFAGVG